jgi:hypothetical protein
MVITSLVSYCITAELRPNALKKFNCNEVLRVAFQGKGRRRQCDAMCCLGRRRTVNPREQQARKKKM